MPPDELNVLRAHFYRWLGTRAPATFRKYVAEGAQNHVLYVASVENTAGQPYQLYRMPDLSDVWVAEGALLARRG